jgi:hypothetical protein
MAAALGGDPPAPGVTGANGAPAAKQRRPTFSAPADEDANAAASAAPASLSDSMAALDPDGVDGTWEFHKTTPEPFLMQVHEALCLQDIAYFFVQSPYVYCETLPSRKVFGMSGCHPEADSNPVWEVDDTIQFTPAAEDTEVYIAVKDYMNDAVIASCTLQLKDLHRYGQRMWVQLDPGGVLDCTVRYRPVLFDSAAEVDPGQVATSEHKALCVEVLRAAFQPGQAENPYVTARLPYRKPMARTATKCVWDTNGVANFDSSRQNTMYMIPGLTTGLFTLAWMDEQFQQLKQSAVVHDSDQEDPVLILLRIEAGVLSNPSAAMIKGFTDLCMHLVEEFSSVDDPRHVEVVELFQKFMVRPKIKAAMAKQAGGGGEAEGAEEAGADSIFVTVCFEAFDENMVMADTPVGKATVDVELGDFAARKVITVNLDTGGQLECALTFGFGESLVSSASTVYNTTPMTRVQRGRDWVTGNQDGGARAGGWVVAVKDAFGKVELAKQSNLPLEKLNKLPKSCAVVHWDSGGGKRFYPIGIKEGTAKREYHLQLLHREKEDDSRKVFRHETTVDWRKLESDQAQGLLNAVYDEHWRSKRKDPVKMLEGLRWALLHNPSKQMVIWHVPGVVELGLTDRGFFQVQIFNDQCLAIIEEMSTTAGVDDPRLPEIIKVSHDSNSASVSRCLFVFQMYQGVLARPEIKVVMKRGEDDENEQALNDMYLLQEDVSNNPTPESVNTCPAIIPT